MLDKTYGRGGGHACVSAATTCLDDTNFRRIGRILSVDHTGVMNWVNACSDSVDEAPVAELAEPVEMDEVCTYFGGNNDRFFVMSRVDRATHCTPSLRVVPNGTGTVVKEMLH
jgi:hypothetical protein